MASNYVIYSYFNGEQIQGVLNAVVMLVGSGSVNGDYLGLIRVVALLGLMMSIMYGFLRARGEDAAYYLILLALWYSTLFVPRVSVTIEEKGGNGVVAPVVVANVPLGLAFFASTTSHIGYWLTERTETFFSLPDTSLKLSSNGLMGAARALRLANSANLPDPIVASDMTNFMRDCVNPELVESAAAVQALLVSTNIWTDISTTGFLNAGRMVTLTGQPGAVDCVTGRGILNTKLGASATSELDRIARMLSPNATVADANTMFKSLLPAAEGLMIATSQTAADAIKQRIMVNVLNDTSANMAQIMNDPVAGQAAVGTAIAASNANASYVVMAKLASEAMPMIRNAVELIIIGIFPIVMILIILAGSKGGLVLRSYVLTMFWVQLWAPLYAILNYVGTLQGAKSMKGALAGVDGVSVMNAAQFATAGISSEAIAGMLTIMVPTIAYALVKGGEVAMSGVTSGLMSPTQSAASAAGSQVGSGNISMGNTSWGNYSANNWSGNKVDTGLKMGTTERAEYQGRFNSAVMRGGVPEGMQTGKIVSDISNIGVTGETTSRADHSNGRTSAIGADMARSQSADLSKGITGGYRQEGGGRLDRTQQQALDKVIQASQQYAQGKGATKTVGSHQGTNTSNESTYTDTARLATGGDIGVGANMEVGNPQPATPQPQQQSPGASTQQGVPATTGALPSSQQSTPPLSEAAQKQAAASAAKVADQLGAGPQSMAKGGAKGSVSLNASMQATSQDSTSFKAGQSSGSERRQQIEDRASALAQAVQQVAGRTTNAAQRSYLEAWVGSFAQQVDSKYQTGVSSRLSESASESRSSTSAVGASLTENMNEAIAQNALRMSGGSLDQLGRNMLSDRGFVSGVKQAMGAQLSEQVKPSGQNPTGLDGNEIAGPRSVHDVAKQGANAVGEARAKNDASATQAGQGYVAKGKAQAAAMGAPTSDPNLTEAQNTFDKFQGSAQKQIGTQEGATRRSFARDALLASVFQDQGGMGRLLDAQLPSFLQFDRAKTPEENQAAFNRVMAANPEFQKRLDSIEASGGKVTQEDREAFYSAVKATK